MKKPFKNTGIGKVLTSPLVKGLIKAVPFGVGDIAGNVLDEVKGSDEAGKVHWPSVTPQIIKLLIYAALALAVLKGWVTFEEAENAKDLVTH